MDQEKRDQRDDKHACACDRTVADAPVTDLPLPFALPLELTLLKLRTTRVSPLIALGRSPAWAAHASLPECHGAAIVRKAAHVCRATRAHPAHLHQVLSGSVYVWTAAVSTRVTTPHGSSRGLLD